MRECLLVRVRALSACICIEYSIAYALCGCVRVIDIVIDNALVRECVRLSSNLRIR